MRPDWSFQLSAAAAVCRQTLRARMVTYLLTKSVSWPRAVLIPLPGLQLHSGGQAKNVTAMPVEDIACSVITDTLP